MAKLSRQIIIDQAIHLLDQYGLGDVTMRRLATFLQVQPGAIYWHFTNKQELLTACALTFTQPLVIRGETPKQIIQAWVEDLAQLVLAHKDGAELMTIALAYADHYPPQVALRKALLDSGVSAENATSIADILLHYLLNKWVVNQTKTQFKFNADQQLPVREQEMNNQDFPQNTSTTLELILKLVG